MKIKSLILSSVAIVGFSTAAMAADLGTVLTSLDVCDALGISGLTISSDTDCLQITGNVSYEFKWGDYNASQNIVGGAGTLPFAVNGGSATVPDNNGVTVASKAAAIAAANIAAANAVTATAAALLLPSGTPALAAIRVAAITAANAATAAAAAAVAAANALVVGANLDWNSNVTAWLKFVATADSSFGPAKATIKFDYSDKVAVVNEVGVAGGAVSPTISEAWVSVGDSTVLMAGLKGSIANTGNDEPFNYLGLFNSANVDTGVNSTVANGATTGGHVIQLVSDLGNGMSIKGGLENLNGGATAGTAVGVLEYAGSGVAGHITVLATNVLSGTIGGWAVHSGISADIQNFKIRGALAADSTGFWNVLGTAQATFDMFTLAGSAEATSANEIGFGVSAAAQVTTGVKINAGFRWFDTNTTLANTESYDAALQLVAAVTDTLTLTGTVGVTGNNYLPAPAVPNVAYFGGELAWAPGGGFTSSVAVNANALGAYSATFKAAKDFM